jgi:hypothetical protein
MRIPYDIKETAHNSTQSDVSNSEQCIGVDPHPYAWINRCSLGSFLRHLVTYRYLNRKNVL